MYHAEHRIHAAMAETEAACTQLAESQAAAVVLVEALRKATASAASLGGATAAELTSGAESVLQSMQAATARMQHMSNLQAAAKAELGSDGSADSLPAAASSLQHMAPAIREMQGDALRYVQERSQPFCFGCHFALGAQHDDVVCIDPDARSMPNIVEGVCTSPHAVHPSTTACGVHVSRLREELEAARAREVELNTELAAAQECFKMVRSWHAGCLLLWHVRCAVGHRTTLPRDGAH